MMMDMAAEEDINKKGTRKVRVKKDLPKRIFRPARRAVFSETPRSDRLWVYIVKASERESDTATEIIPLITATLDEVAPSSPAITPSVVRTAPDIPPMNRLSFSVILVKILSFGLRFASASLK